MASLRIAPRTSRRLTVLVAIAALALGSGRSSIAQDRQASATRLTSTCDFTDTAGIYQSCIHDACVQGLITGCGGARFCPGEFVMREDMAVYLEKLYRGSAFSPPVPTTDPFTDVSKTYPFAGWIKQLSPACDGITAGCDTGAYCPYSFVTRWQMAVFLSVVTSARRGETVPPWGFIGGRPFNCTSTPHTDCPAQTSLFTDVPWNDGGCPFVHYIYALGITSGCATNAFCPTAFVPREQMATFLISAFLKQTQPAPSNPCP